MSPCPVVRDGQGSASAGRDGSCSMCPVAGLPPPVRVTRRPMADVYAPGDPERIEGRPHSHAYPGCFWGGQSIDRVRYNGRAKAASAPCTVAGAGKSGMTIPGRACYSLAC
eukprot:353695-Chlamydomonas_euryale.AAC.5